MFDEGTIHEPEVEEESQPLSFYIRKAEKMIESRHDLDPEKCNLEVMAPQIRDLYEVLGEDKATQLMSHFIYQAGSKTPEWFIYNLKNFSKEKHEAAISFFGKDRVDKYTQENYRVSMSGFSEEEWTAFAEAIGDEEPYDLAWEIVSDTHWPEAWVTASTQIESWRAALSDEEFQTILSNPKTRSLLIHDKRSHNWPLRDSAWSSESFLTQDKLAAWRTFLGDDFARFLEMGPIPKLLENTTPKKLKEAQEIIPNLKDHFLPDGKIGERYFDDLVHFMEYIVPSISKIKEILTEKQGDLLARRSTEDLKEFSNWFRDTYSFNEFWDLMKNSLSEEYIEKMFREPRLLSHYANRLPTLFAHSYDHEMFGLILKKREGADKAMLGDPVISAFANSYKQALPFLRLRYDRLREEKLSEEDALKEIKHWVQKMNPETKNHLDPVFVPSVGVEIEILTDNLREREEMPHEKRERIDYAKTLAFGITKGTYDPWEFAVDPSSPAMQARFVSELVAGEWINPERMEDGNYSMQVNIGVPEGSAANKPEIGVLVYALTSAYGNEKRLAEGGYNTFFKLKNDYMDDDALQSRVDGQPYSGRFEFRAFSSERDTVYRLLHDTPALSAAFFAAQRETPRNDRDKQLATIWKRFNADAKRLLESVGLDWKNAGHDYNMSEKRDYANKLMATQDKMKVLVKGTARAVRVICKSR